MYSSSVAARTHGAVMKAVAAQFVDSTHNHRPKWESLIYIGDAYARGKYPFLAPNASMALICYRVAASCPSDSVVASATSRITEMRLNPVSTTDQAGAAMPTQHGNYACKAAVRYISQNKQAQKRVSLKIRATPLPLAQALARGIPADIQPQQTRARRHAHAQVAETVDPNTIRPRNLGGGSQNTHDHGVVTATKANINHLKDEYPNYVFRDHSTVVDEAMQICNRVVEDPHTSGVTKDTVHDVFEVVTSLTTDAYADTGLTQIQILDLALKKILTLDASVSKGVQETLCKRLATGLEDGKTVCATGKVARIVSVFEGVDDRAQKSVSVPYVEREIAQMAANVRDEFLERVGPMGRKAYESEQSVPEYGASMAAILRQKVTEEYVQKLNMSPTIIEPLIDLYSGAF